MMSIKEINTKVCIIGAGASGLVVSNILSKYGVPCVVIEQQAQSELYAKFRASLIDRRTMAILQEHGLSDRLLRAGKPQGKCEFRTPQDSFILDYARLSGGQTCYSYPQQELISDLLYKFQASGGQILFDTRAIEIQNERYGAKVICQYRDRELTINSDFIAGCDGSQGISRTSIPESIARSNTVSRNYAWLEVTAEVPPSSDRIIYGTHPRGFAAHLLGTDNLSRFYLQIALEDTIADWTSDRIWSELQLRLAQDDWTLNEGIILGRQILTLDSYIAQTMQYKSLFLAGDAAHAISPAAEQSVNLAIQDADVLAKSFACYYCCQDNQLLKNYSTSRLPEVYRTHDFFNSLLHTVNTPTENNSEDRNLFNLLQKFKLAQLMNSESYAKDFAYSYVGAATETVIQPTVTDRQLLPPARLLEPEPLVVGVGNTAIEYSANAKDSRHPF